MKVLLIILSLTFLSCSKYDSKQLNSGTPTDSPNGRDLVTLNYRIKDTAIAQHSLTLLKQVNELRFEQVPSAWPQLDLEELVGQLRFLHKKPSRHHEAVTLKKGRLASKLSFSTITGEKKHLRLNNSVTELSWTTPAGMDVDMKRVNSVSWLLTTAEDTVSLYPSLRKICYLEACIDL